MAVEVDRVIVALEARLDNYNRNLNDAERHFDRTMRNIDTTAGRTEARIATAFRGVGTAAALLGVGVGALAAAMTTGAGVAVMYASSLAEVARQTGLTVEQVQVLERAAVRNNFTMAQASSAIGDLNRKLGEARSGSASAVQAFRSIGITKEQLDSFRSARDALPVVMNAIRSLGTETEQAAAANRVMGESGEALLPFLRQGADGYNLIAEEARASGLVTQEQAQRAEEAKQRLQELALTLRTNVASALVDILPFIENVAAAFGRLGSTASSVFSWIRDQARQPGSLLPFAFASFYPSNQRGGRRTGDRYGSSGFIAAAMAQGLGPTTTLGPPSVSGGSKPRGAGRGRRGPDPAEIARREAEAERRFQFELSQLEEDILLARQIWATSAQQVSEFEIRQIEATRERENANYLAEAENARTNQAAARARAAQLVEANNRLAAEKTNNANLRRQEREREEAVELAQATTRSEEEIARITGRLAETRQEQRDSALALLDLSLQQERLEQEAVLASREATEAQKQIARARLAALNRIETAETAGIFRDTESPRDRYLRSLERTGEQMNDDLDQVAINGFERLNEELTESITGFIRLGGIAGRVLDSILSDLLRIGIQQQIIRPLANALFSGGGFSSLFGGGKAAGGPVSSNKMYLVGERGPELFVPSSAGNIVPQGGSFGAMPGMASAGAGGGLVRVQLALSGDIDARIVQVSGPVAVEVVQTATPGIVRAAGAETMRAAMRPRLNR